MFTCCITIEWTDRDGRIMLSMYNLSFDQEPTPEQIDQNAQQIKYSLEHSSCAILN
jgi:hypothetical protein